MNAQQLSTTIFTLFVLCTTEPQFGSRKQIKVGEGEESVTFYERFVVLHRDKILDVHGLIKPRTVLSDERRTQLGQLHAALESIQN